MSSERRKQQKLEKHKKKREAAKQRSRRELAKLSPSAAALLRAAANASPGPFYISGSWQSEGVNPPELVNVFATRTLADGRLVVGSALLDRTCLGVKDAMFRELTREQFESMLARFGEGMRGFEVVDAATALSVVYNAVDYAHSLGFEPHRDFPTTMFSPRPEALLETPLGHPSRPVYVSGPNDDPALIVEKLLKAVGPDNFDVVLMGDPRTFGAMVSNDDDFGDDGDFDDDVIDAEGEAVE